jgi:hypothetical protein
MLKKLYWTIGLLCIFLVYQVGLSVKIAKTPQQPGKEKVVKQLKMPTPKLKKLQAIAKNKDKILKRENEQDKGNLQHFLKKPKVGDYTIPFSFRKIDFESGKPGGQRISNLLINGSSAATVSFGDSIVVTFEFAPGAFTAIIYVYIDVNQNGIIDPSDMLIDSPYPFFDNSVEDEDTTWGYFRYTIPQEGEGSLDRINADFVIEVDDGYSSGTATLSVNQAVTGYSISGSIIPGYEKVVIVAVSWEIGQYVTITDMNGDFTLYVPDDTPRDWTMVAADFLQVHGNVIPPEPQSIYINGAITNYNFLFQNADAWVQGTVMDENSAGVEGIHILAENNVPEFLLDTTDVSGNYLGGVLSNFFNVGLWLTETDLWPNYLARAYGTEVYPIYGDTITADISVYQADSYISGNIYLDGAPVWGVLLVGISMDYENYIITYSNLDGSYQLPVASELDMTGGYFIVVESLPDDIFSTPEFYEFIPSGSSNINFDLTRITGGVEGYVYDYQTGLPVVDTWISVYNDTLWYDTDTDEQGYYRINALPGDYVFEVNHWNYVPIQRFDLSIQDYLIREDYQLVEFGDCYLAGNVSNQSGLPLEGARITFFDFYSGSFQSNAFTDSAIRLLSFMEHPGQQSIHWTLNWKLVAGLAAPLRKKQAES